MILWSVPELPLLMAPLLAGSSVGAVVIASMFESKRHRMLLMALAACFLAISIARLEIYIPCDQLEGTWLWWVAGCGARP